MSRRNENWLLVEWVGGGTGVVYLKSVLSPVNTELKTGDVLSVNWRGEPKQATLVARAKERNQLESKTKEEPAAGSRSRSPNPEEEGYDFSASGSSWAPSDEEAAASGDSDKETSKKIKLENCKRQYTRNSKKVLTPSHRANAVIPTKMMLDPNSKKSDARKRTYNKISRNGSYNKSLPDSTKVNNTMNGTRKQTVSIDIHELEEIGNSFSLLFKMLEDLKRPAVGLPDITISNNKDLPINGTVNETTMNEDYDGEYENEEDFDRSDDNVLITNKYDTQYADASSVSPKEMVKKNVIKTNTNIDANQNEWVPIGSGKTMIHNDQFKKVNWKSYTIATRTLLLAIFPRRILATHSLTGKRSPAFQNKPAKMCLDPKIISDVIMEITDRFNVKENLVRSIITTKCADECKMLKQRKGKSNKNNNQENVPPKTGYVAS